MDLPPISVVTTAGIGGTSRRPPKNNAPIILVKPSKNDPLSTTTASKRTTSIQHTSDNIPDPPNNNSPNVSTAVIHKDALNSIQAQANSQVQAQANLQSSPQASTEAGANDKQVDSALLSALRDKRERIALLRLEKNLIDFMNDKTCGYMEVGGQGNSVVVRGASGGTSSDDNAVEHGNGTTTTSVAIPTAATNNATTTTARAQGSSHGYNGNNDTSGGRQTSFQRLCLHRLADRFNIVREQGYHNPNNSNNQIIGLIRLVKIKESRVPTVKLINLDLTLYNQSTIPQDRNDGFGVTGISDRLAVANLQEGGSGKKSKKKERVKIMKRSSSSGLAGGNGKSDKSNSSKQKGKKLSDKEKAYAEARARIFNSNESNVNSLGESEHADSEIVNPPHGSANRSADTSPVSSNSTNASANLKATYLVPSQVSPNTGEQILTTSRTKDAKRGNLPAAATGGAASKVLWRNREQEASDPDFQCRHHPGMLQVMPGQMQYHQYAPQNGMNPSSGNFHYGAVTEGQSFNRGAGYYGSAPPSHHQTDASWNRHEHKFVVEGPRQRHGANGDESTPSNEPSSDSNLAQEINLSKDEFPALQ